MAKSDCVVIWGTNAVVTQVNVMTHAIRARKERGAKIVVIDIYDNATMKQADMGLILKPGTDGALACAVMHVLFRDGLADRAYLEKYTDDPKGLEAHLRDAHAGMGGGDHRPCRSTRSRPSPGSSARRRKPSSASATALRASATARSTCMPRCRSPPSPAAGNMRAAAPSIPIPASSSSTRSVLEGTRLRDPNIRYLDQSRIGPVLTGDADALYGGPPVTAMLIQNTNPVNVAPEQRLVKQGFLRDDLFTCVHEQFMTDTAKLADVVLPATMFLEHDDIYAAAATSTSCSARS